MKYVLQGNRYTVINSVKNLQRKLNRQYRQAEKEWNENKSD